MHPPERPLTHEERKRLARMVRDHHEKAERDARGGFLLDHANLQAAAEKRERKAAKRRMIAARAA